MRHKRKLLAGMVATSVAIILSTPMAASAATYTPDGSAPYGKDTICTATDAAMEDGDTSLATCSALPQLTWSKTALPKATADSRTNVTLSDLDYAVMVGSEGSLFSAEEGTNEANFFVAPTKPGQLPFIASSTISVYGHNTDALEIKDVTAYFVADSKVVEKNDPFTGLSGTRTTSVKDGTTTELAVAALGDGQYDLTLNLPSATWTQSTDGLLNGYGWSGRVVMAVNAVADGKAVTMVEQYSLSFNSEHLYDITNFYAEAPQSGDDIGVGTAAYSLTGETTYIEGTPVTPTAPDPEPTPEPSDPEPTPEATPPTPTEGDGDPEDPVTTTDPSGPTVEAGADSSTNVNSWVPVGILAGGVLGMFPLLAVLRRRERAQQ